MSGVRGAGYSFAITFGIGGGIATYELPDGTKRRDHLDVGENPPNGGDRLLLAGRGASRDR